MNVYLQENLELLRGQEDSETWMAYVDYVDEMVVDGFFSTVQCSLKFLLDNTSPRPEPASLFEAILELQVILQSRKVKRIIEWQVHYSVMACKALTNLLATYGSI